MIYGNIARNMNKYYAREQAIDESFIIGDDEKYSLMEQISYSILNDDDCLLEYCNTYADPYVLNEASKGILNSIVEFIKGIVKKIAEFFNGIIEKIKKFFGKRKFKTDDKGDLTKEAQENLSNSSSEESNSSKDSEETSGGSSSHSYTAKPAQKAIGTSKNNNAARLNAPVEAKYTSLYDMAGHDLGFLDVEISIPDYFAKPKEGVARIKEYTKYTTSTLQDLKKAVADIKNVEDRSETGIDRIKLDVETYIKRGDTNWGTIDEPEKKTIIHKSQIDSIIEGTKLDEAECTKNIKDEYKKAQDVLSDLQGYMNSEIVTKSRYNPDTDKDERVPYDKMKEEDMKADSKYTQGLASLFTTIAKNTYKIYTNYCSYVQKYINQCTTARIQLENALYKLNRYVASHKDFHW